MPSFKLRPGKDKDLTEAINNLDPNVDKSTVYRAALRLYFFGPHAALRHFINEHALHTPGIVESVDNPRTQIKTPGGGIKIVVGEKRPT